MTDNLIKCVIDGDDMSQIETMWVEIIEGDDEAGIGRVKKPAACSNIQLDDFVEYWKDDDWMPKARAVSPQFLTY